MAAIFGKTLSIKNEELGAFIATLAAEGQEEDGLIYNQTAVEGGQRALKKKSS